MCQCTEGQDAASVEVQTAARVQAVCLTLAPQVSSPTIVSNSRRIRPARLAMSEIVSDSTPRFMLKASSCCSGYGMPGGNGATCQWT